MNTGTVICNLTGNLCSLPAGVVVQGMAEEQPDHDGLQLKVYTGISFQLTRIVKIMLYII